ncbi:hypothetical protein SAMN04488542_10484 [Fontibacillus panacisegetis]|uniref:DUF4190 domain-containing protein n=1 Tax=Fontibacillus panacisegetis TaxID=670482 RepID=A0A1G7HAT7_9BACL|nr:hypothetical protein [Fontibacillus panacisegetis]SDE97552.1 hypothetical protein SAMN04488542_10484 [Fontibacillus panacisegetis]
MESIYPENRPSYGVDRYGFAITSFIAGMIGFLTLLFILTNDPDNYSDGTAVIAILLIIISSILGVIFGSLAFSSKRGKGLGIAGFVISIISLVFFIFLLIVGILVS